MAVGVGALLLSSGLAGLGLWGTKKAYDIATDPNAPVKGKIGEGETFDEKLAEKEFLGKKLREDIEGDPDGGGLLDVVNEGKGYYDAQTNQTFPSQEAWIDYKDKYPHKYAWEMMKPFETLRVFSGTGTNPAQTADLVEENERAREMLKREEILKASRAAKSAAQALAAGWRNFANNNRLNEDINKMQEIYAKTEHVYPTMGGGGKEQSRGFKPPPGWNRFDNQ